MGYLEAASIEKRKLIIRTSKAVDSMPPGAKERGMFAKIKKMMDRPFYDLSDSPIIFDIFERPWGTEVLAYVWLAEWDDIVVTLMDEGFAIEVNLGADREIEIGSNRFHSIGGRWYIRYRQKRLNILADPKLMMQDGVLHLLFDGLVIPNMDHMWKYGPAGSRSGDELISHLEELDWTTLQNRHDVDH